jgi:formylglycine-generating enzyme required for sulfatase activity
VTAPIDVFISYAPEDEALRTELAKHLASLRGQGAIDPWHAGDVPAGADWRALVLQKLSAARLVLLLVSSDFLASEQCMDAEAMRDLLRRERADSARVVPILLRACDWQSAPFAHTELLPHDDRAITSWPNRDEAWAAVAARIGDIVHQMRLGTMIEMISVPRARFWMGADDGPAEERPRHQVALSAFQVAKHPVTQRQYGEIMRAHPSIFEGGDLPVHNVGFRDAIEFCNRLSKREGLTAAYAIRGDVVTANRSADGFRLPTEAEWEYAARGGDGRRYPWGDELPSKQLCWNGKGNDLGYKRRSGPCPVGRYPRGRSPSGPLDMAGNVWEWCWDWYGPYDDAKGTLVDPAGPASGEAHVVRGGAWSTHDPVWVTATHRVAVREPDGIELVGFRCARSERR